MQAAAYLPDLLRTGRAPGTQSISGTFISADLSGFTRLSERLAQRGREGAEVLSDAIDSCFTSLIDRVVPLGGDVLHFGGDALFVAFTGTHHRARGVEAALAMQALLRSEGTVRTPVGNVRLSISIGVASGTAEVVVGEGPQRPLFVVGPVVTRTVALESAAEAGQVVVAPATATVVAAHRRRRHGEGWLLVPERHSARSGATAAGHTRGTGGDPVPHLPAASLADPTLHLPAALRSRLVGGDAPREHRRVAVGFVGLGGLDRLPPAGRESSLRELSAVLGEACDALGVCWVGTDVLGDGAKAILAGGIPHQGPDDAERLAAVARRVVESDLGRHLRIGLHNGTAFVGDIGHPGRRTYTIMGDSVNVAARLMGAADPGEVLVTPAVLEPLHGRYATGTPRDLALKGKAAPVTVVALGTTRTTPSPPTLPDGTSRPIGRDAELAVLGDAVAELGRRTGVADGMVIEVVAAPGMGKSHMLTWLRGEARRVVPTVAVFDVIGQLAANDVAFGATTGPLRAMLGLDAEDSRAAVRLAELAGELAALLGPAVGVQIPPSAATAALEPRSVEDRRIEVLVDTIRTLTTAPALLVVEDAHWLDAASSVLLSGTAGRLADAGWLVVLSRRPDAPVLVEGSRELPLGPLDDGARRRLATHLAGDRALSDAVLDELVERSAGNPLFLAQLVHSSAAGEDIGLPATAESVVGARIDVLPKETRHRLRQASVLGTDVDLDLLEDITGEAGDDIWDGLEEFVSAEPGRLHFKHDLFRLAAYEGLPFSERAELHERAGLRLEQRPGTPPAVIARHFRQSNRSSRAADWAELAAREAEEKSAFADAARLWQHAATSSRRARRPAEAQARVRAELGRVHEVLADSAAAEAAYGEAIKLCAPQDRAPIRVRLAWVAFRSDDLRLAKRRVTLALKEADAVPGVLGAAAVHTELLLLRSAVRSMEGDLAGSDDDARRAESDAAVIGRADLRAEALLQLALNADLIGAPDAAELAGRAFTLLAATNKHYELAVLHGNIGITHMEHGRWPAALEEFDAAGRELAISGNVLGAFANDLSRGGILLEQGHVAEAIDMFDDVRRRASAAQNERKSAFAQGSAARARGWAGDLAGIDTLTGCIDTLAAAGHASEALSLRAYLLELRVLQGSFGHAMAEGVPLLAELDEGAGGEVVVLSVQRLLAVAGVLADAAGGAVTRPSDAALAGIHEVLARAREQGASIEVARCLQALEVLSGDVDPAWASEREDIGAELGVVWMPPLTFAGAGVLGPAPNQPMAGPTS